MIRNQYNGGDFRLRGNALQYTCPTGKIAKINFDSASCLRTSDSYVSKAAFQVIAQKTNGNGKFLSNFVIGYYKSSNNKTGQMITWRPWWAFMEGQQGTTRNTGNGTISTSGYSTARFIESAFSGNNNDLTSSTSSTIQNDPSTTNSNTPYGPSHNDTSMCDAQKDYIVPAGTQIYVQYYVEQNTSVTQTYNQFDITLKVEEMDDYA